MNNFWISKSLRQYLEKEYKEVYRANKKELKFLNSEIELIKHIAKGYTSTQIANLLNKTVNNIKQRRKNLYKKLGVNSRIELIRKAISLNLIKCREVANKYKYIGANDISPFIKYKKDDNTKFNLVEKEINILKLLVKGYTREMIIKELSIASMYTYNMEKMEIINKLGAKNIIEAITIAVVNNIIN